MLKTILMSGLLSSMLLLSGCGGDSEGESILQTQQMLDNGDFEGVIAKLENRASTKEDYINLASAYMGKAGMTITNLITAITAGEDNDDSSGFATFVKGISVDSNPTALSDLEKAREYFREVVGNKCGKNDENLSDASRNICLYVGMASTGSAAITIDLIAGDIDSFGATDANGDAIVDNKLLASTCAMQYAFDRSKKDCNVTEVKKNVNFTQLNKVYTSLEITVENDPEKYYYLMNDANRTVLTKGYCTNTDFATRTENEVAGYYVCPLNENAATDDTTTAGVLVDVLNSGLDSIKSSVSGDVVDDINEFKCEILGGTYSDNDECSVSLDDDVTESAIIDYLNKENKE